MRLALVAVGKLRPPLREVEDDYLRRLRRFVAVDEREVREAGRAGNAAVQRSMEGRHLLDAIAPRDVVVLLDVAGECWSSEQVAEQLDAWRADGRDRSLVVGGAAGVADEVAQRANLRWSLGAITLPHELARVVMTEQLYRASTILRGEPYHKGAR